MNRSISPCLLLAALLCSAPTLAQDAPRGYAVERGQARLAADPYPNRGAPPRPDHGAHWSRQGELYWERDERRVREQGSRFYPQPPKHERGHDRRWQVERGLPHSDPRYSHERDPRNRDLRRDWRDPAWRAYWHHGWSGQRYRAPIRYHYPQGYARYHWRTGYTLPSAFLISSWHVDYRPYGLAAPPYGCRWVRVDGDLLLVDLSSGHIVDVLYRFFY